jgi:hypothetical protein
MPNPVELIQIMVSRSLQRISIEKKNSICETVDDGNFWSIYATITPLIQYHGFVAYLSIKEATCFLDIFYYFQRLVEAPYSRNPEIVSPFGLKCRTSNTG